MIANFYIQKFGKYKMTAAYITEDQLAEGPIVLIFEQKVGLNKTISVRYPVVKYGPNGGLNVPHLTIT